MNRQVVEYFKKNPKRELEDFSRRQRKIIFERDKHQSIICGRGEKDEDELHVDHIKPKDLGGKATIENVQTLCATHNFLKKNYKQTETGTNMFIRLYDLSKDIGDKKTQEFCKQVWEVFEEKNINGHIDEWKR